jgi:parallel beta-helix repeat protein
MSGTVTNAKMLQRRDTAANWASNNPVLLAGELGLETTGLCKIGNGSTAWNNLSYAYDKYGAADEVADILSLTSVKEYGASGSAETTTGTTVAGGTSLSLAAALDFENGQGITIHHAGAACTLSIPSAPTVTQNGTTGSTEYYYKVAALDGNGGCSAASDGTTITDGNETLGSTNYVTVSWTAVTDAAAYGVYGRLNNSSGMSLLAITTSTSWNDKGTYAIDSYDAPSTPPFAALADILTTTISDGAGTTTLTLADAATTTTASSTIEHDDTIAVQSGIDALSEGDVLFFPAGTYMVTGLTVHGKTRCSFIGVGGGSCIKLRAFSNATLFNVTWSDRALFTRLRLYGDKDNNLSGSGMIVTDNSAYVQIESMEIDDFADYGIKCLGSYDTDGTTFIYTDEVHTNQSFIYNNGKDGIYLGAVGGFIITNNELEYNGNNGLTTGYDHSIGSNGHIIAGNNIFSNKNQGIHLYESSRVRVDHNAVVYNSAEGIYTEGGELNFISNNSIELNGQSNNAPGIKCAYQSDTWIVGNMDTNDTGSTASEYYGLQLYGVTGAHVLSNSFTNHPTGSVYVDSSTYTAIGNEGIDDNVPTIGSKVYASTVTDNVISATIVNYTVGQAYYVCLSGAVAGSATLSVNSGTAYNLVDMSGNAITSVADGAVIQIYQATSNSNYQVI